ncbi:MAG: flagellar export protein FliJ [Treponema sp.]|jgi:flagellar FliJ protein|nr:flagellar export protein FliJ [Treponema sp.]
MKAFAFKLEKLLKLRRYREQETEISLGRETGRLSAIEARIKLIAGEKKAAAAERFAKNNGARDIITIDNYMLRLEQTKENLLQAAAKQELLVEEARAVFLEASRERKIIDKLKDRRAAEYRAFYLREETKTIDDISSSSRQRNY